MVAVILTCALLLAVTTLLHYEALRGLNRGLASLRIPDRTKLILVIIVAFFAHAAEIALYGGAYYGLITWLQAGSLSSPGPLSLANCMYLSAETYTSLGFGDVAPLGPVRMLAGIEALNGLLLIGWSASFAYISMERFWSSPQQTGPERSGD